MTRKVKKEKKNYHSPNKTVIMKRLSNYFLMFFGPWLYGFSPYSQKSA